MSGYVDLSERVTAQYYNAEYEEWTQETTTIAEILDSVCDDYTVLPSTQTQRMKGRWIRDDFGSFCESCGLYAYLDKFGEVWESNYCPNCGADMRGEQNGKNS